LQIPTVYASARPDWQVDALCSHSQIVYSSVTKLVNMIFWQHMNRFWW